MIVFCAFTALMSLVGNFITPSDAAAFAGGGGLFHEKQNHSRRESTKPAQLPKPAQPPKPPAPVVIVPPPPPTPSPENVVHVGPSRTYKNPREALAVAAPGTIIEIDPGTYDDSSYVSTDNMTVRGAGIGPRVIPVAVPIAGPDQGVYVAVGQNLTFENLEIAQSYGDGSQAAIRLRSPGLVTLRNMLIHHSDDGILGGSGGQLVVEDSTIHSCGTGTGQNHNIYVAASLTKASFIRLHNYGANIGHLLKSRAQATEVIGGLYDDTANASLAFDFPEGGDVLIDGALARKGPQADSSWFIAYGEEVGANIPPPRRPILHRIVITNSAFRNEQEVNSNGATLAGSGLLIRIGGYFDASMLTIDNVDLYWPDDRLNALQDELTALAAAGAKIRNVRVRSINSAAWPPWSDVNAVADNTWVSMTPSPSTRYIPQAYTATDVLTNQSDPVGRSYSGIHYGNGKMLYFGGGHGSHPGNDVELYDVGRNIWQQQYKPEVCPFANPACLSVYNYAQSPFLSPLGRPYPEHTYQEIAYDPANRRFVAVLNLGTFAFDPGTAQWAQLNAESFAGGDVHTRHVMMYDQDLGTLSAVQTAGPNTGVYRLNQATQAWQRIGTIPVSGWVALYSTYLPDQHVHMVLGWGKWWRFNAVTATWTEITGVPVDAYNIDSFDYDTRNKVVIGVEHKATAFKVWAYDPQANTWTRLAVSGPSPTQSEGASAFSPLLRYDPIHNIFIFLEATAGAGGTGGTTRTWAYRYRQ